MFSGHPRTPVAPTTPKSESRHVASSTSVTPDVVGQAHRLGDIQAQGHSQSQHQRDQSTDSDTGKLSSTLAAHASAQTEQSKQGLQQLLDTVAAAESVPEHTRNVITGAVSASFDITLLFRIDLYGRYPGFDVTALLKQEQFRLEHQERHQSQANGAGADSNSSSAGNATAAMTSNVSVPTSTAWFDMVRDNHVPAGQVLLGFEYIPVRLIRRFFLGLLKLMRTLAVLLTGSTSIAQSRLGSS